MIKRFLPFIFAGVLGLAAVVLMQQHLRQQQRLIEQERKKLYANYQPPVKIIVALKDIPEGTTMTEESLGVRDIPQNFVQPYAISRPEDVLGQVARTPFAEGEQILRNKLRRPEEATPGATLATVTPKGQRAVTIGADMLTGVGGFIQPGDAVDVLWSFQAPTPGDEKGEPVTVTLFQDVKVLAINDLMVGKAADGKAASGDYTVTLSLAPQQAELLLHAREQGQLQLSLRPHEEATGAVEVPPANIAALIESVLGPQAVRPEPGAQQRTVEVFKGLERSVVSVNE